MTSRTGYPVTKKLGRPSILSYEQEEELTQLIKDMVNRMFGLNHADIRRLVYRYCEQNNIRHNFSKKTKSAGRDWFEGFLRRHPDLANRTPEPTSVHRAIGFNAAKAKIFYDKLRDILFDKEENGGTRLIPETQVYNVDESGYTVCHKPSKVVAVKGQRRVGAMTSAEKGRTVTAICCVSAAGHYVPPMLVYPRKRIKAEMVDRAPTGSICAGSMSGWVNEELFEKWFNHFVDTVQPKARPQPTLLILDGHVSHTKNMAVIVKARDNNVILLSLPSHCTHRLQPLDVSVFKSLNTFYNAAVQKWIMQHHRPVTEWQIAELFAEAYASAATVRNAQKGFSACGIHPFDPNKFQEKDFLASELTERPNESSMSTTAPG